MIKLIFRILFIAILVLFVYFVGILIYVWWTDFIPDKTKNIAVTGNSVADIIEKDTVSFLSWNIGYGGLGEESDFFYDGGETVTLAKHLVEKNIAGISRTILDFKHSVDFFLLQEVDVGSKRAHWINQFDKVGEILSGFSASFGKNYDVEYIPIPPMDPMGKVEAGIASWSKYRTTESTRYSFEGNFEFPYHLFFLDRCFLMNRYHTKSSKDLIVINTHNSAYDDGSLKEKQLQQLRKIALQEFGKGNYVVIGGDWNQNPSGYLNNANQKASIPQYFPAKGWTCSFDSKTSTNRKLVEPYHPNTTETTLIDFYVVSPNIDVLEVKTIDQQFKYSDHQAVVMNAILK